MNALDTSDLSVFSEAELAELVSPMFLAMVHAEIARRRCQRISESTLEAAPETVRSM